MNNIKKQNKTKQNKQQQQKKKNPIIYTNFSNASLGEFTQINVNFYLI